MDRDAIARGRRRQQATEALEFERYRESALLDQIADLVTDEEGPRIDREAFARMARDEVALVSEVLAYGEPDVETPESDDDPSDLREREEETNGVGAEEIARLEDELASCRRRQRAVERYLEALGPAGDQPG